MRTTLSPENRTDLITMVLNRGAFSPPESAFSVDADYRLVHPGPFDLRLLRQPSPELTELLNDIKSAAAVMGDSVDLHLRTWGNRIIITDPWLVARQHPTALVAMGMLGLSVFEDTDVRKIKPHFAAPRGFRFDQVGTFYAYTHWTDTNADEQGPLVWRTVRLGCPHCVLFEAFKEVVKDVPERGPAIITVVCDLPNDNEAVCSVLQCEVATTMEFSIDSKTPPMSENGVFVRSIIQRFAGSLGGNHDSDD